MKKLNLKFKKWQDPYGENIEDVEFPGFNRVKKVEKAAYQDGDSYDDDDIDEDEDARPDIDVVPNRPLKFIATSMGHIPLTEYTQPSKVFNFWVGHTNFDVTEDIYDVIEEVDGVEILDIFTRYRFRIGIGEMFEHGDVMRDVRKQIFKHIKNSV